MSLTNTPNKESRPSSTNRNAYIVINSPIVSNENTRDPEYNRNYLSAKITERASDLLNTKLSPSVPNLNKCAEQAANTVQSMKSFDKEKTNEEPSTPRLALINTGAVPKNTKVQIGMDRYITITKRKASPRSTQQDRMPKQYKSSNVGSLPTSQNRFAALSIPDDEEAESANVAVIKEAKPPPIYLREQTSNTIVNMLSELVGKNNFYVVSIRRGQIQETKIQTHTEMNFRIISKHLDAAKKSYYTYQLKSAKGLTVVIKGIDSSVPTEEIRSALELEGYEVRSVHNILNRNKVPQPMHRIEIAFDSSLLKSKNSVHPIYNLRYLLSRRITVEEPLKRKGPTQCTNCQEYGHTKSYCKLPHVCVVCGDAHKTSECNHSKVDPNVRKCSNCGENHTANYRGCRVFLHLKEPQQIQKYAHSQYRPRYASSFPAGSYANSIQTNKQNYSYAQVLKENSHGHNPAKEANANQPSYANVLKESPQIPSADISGSIENLVQIMNNFMATMQNMFQEMMRNQNMLLQVLLNKK